LSTASIVSKIISVFNVGIVFLACVLAVCAVVAVVGRRAGLKFFAGRPVLLAFCFAALIALVLEASLFNYPHYYSKYAKGAEVRLTEVSKEDSTIFLTSDGTKAEIVEGGVVFKGLNRRVASVFVICDYKDGDWVQLYVEPTDREGTRGVGKGLPRHSPPIENYMPLHAYGEVSELKVTLVSVQAADTAKAGDSTKTASVVDTAKSASSASVDSLSSDSSKTEAKAVGMAVLKGVALNKTIPLYFSGLRVLAGTCLFFAFLLLSRKRYRAAAAYCLFEYRFDPENGKQKLVYAFSVAALILFSFACAYTSVTEDEVQAKQYNKYLVDALMEGRTHLEAGHPEKLLKAERPYDLGWLIKNDRKPGEDWFGDWVYYKGKFYCYFGVVPALMLYVPYKLITGNYLSNHGGIFIFAAVSILLLARLWRFLVKKYMPDARFAFYLLSFFTLFFASGLFCPLRFTRFYSIVSSAGFMFVIAGVLLLFEAVEREKPDRSKLFFACMCLALAVGCRPNLVFVSLIVPVFLWKYKLWKQSPLIIIPYAIVAVPICLYNHARFGSVFEFGIRYNMTNLNVAAFGLATLSEKIIRAYSAALSYLFSVNAYSCFFPYVECLPTGKYIPVPTFYDRCCGMVNFPVVFCLFCFVKSALIKAGRTEMFCVSAAFVAIAAVLIIADSWLIGVSGRYIIDFAVFIILPALSSAYHWHRKNGEQDKARQKVTYVLLSVSILVGLSLFATTVTNDATPGVPALFRYLQISLGLFGTV
jgi:hypothetical protein